jgi:hypothetical protein
MLEEEGINELAFLCAIELKMPNHLSCQIIPQSRPLGKRLLDKARITLPDAMPHKNITVDTRKNGLTKESNYNINALYAYNRKPGLEDPL